MRWNSLEHPHRRRRHPGDASSLIRPQVYPAVTRTLDLSRPPNRVPSLPVEILALIVASVDTKKWNDESQSWTGDDEPEAWGVLWACSLVSKVFLHLARPRLYEFVFIHLGREVGISEHYLQRQALNVLSTPHLAILVSSVAVSYIDSALRPPEGDHATWSPSVKLADVLAACPSIKTAAVVTSGESLGSWWRFVNSVSVLPDFEAIEVGRCFETFTTHLREVDVAGLAVESDAGRRGLTSFIRAQKELKVLRMDETWLGPTEEAEAWSQQLETLEIDLPSSDAGATAFGALTGSSHSTLKSLCLTNLGGAPPSLPDLSHFSALRVLEWVIPWVHVPDRRPATASLAQLRLLPLTTLIFTIIPPPHPVPPRWLVGTEPLVASLSYLPPSLSSLTIPPSDPSTLAALVVDDDHLALQTVTILAGKNANSDRWSPWRGVRELSEACRRGGWRHWYSGKPWWDKTGDN